MASRVSRSWALHGIGAVLTLASVASHAQAAPVPIVPCPGAAGAVLLDVRITGFKSAKGNATVTVYPDDEKRFLAKGGKLVRARVPITLPVTQACFTLPKAASYEVAVYHDADNDHDFDRTLLGLPAEGYGFSNNPSTRIGLPAFKDARYATRAGQNTMFIKLSY